MGERLASSFVAWLARRQHFNVIMDGFKETIERLESRAAQRIADAEDHAEQILFYEALKREAEWEIQQLKSTAAKMKAQIT